MAVKQMGVGRTARNLLRLNQVDGFDCMSCAWPDPDPTHRHTAEFCENGAKAVAWEGDTRRVGPEFFAEHSLADLERRSEYWMGQQGRLTSTPKGCVAAYYPETNPLIPLGSVALESNTPTSKWVVVRLERA